MINSGNTRSNSRPHHADVIIAGGGMVGLTLACALAQQTALSILVLEANKNSVQPISEKSSYRHRVSAFSLASQRIFKAIGVWDGIQQRRVSLFSGIEVWESWQNRQVNFNSHEIARPALGYIIENDIIQMALEEKIQSLPQINYISGVKLSEILQEETGMKCTSETGESYFAQLIVGADGAHSSVRQQCGIEVEYRDYHQSGVVAVVRTEMPHNSIARQVFLPSGPLAFLPLAETHLSSIVWSLPTEDAKRKLDLSEPEFNKALSSAFSHRLGEVLEVRERFAFPLRKQQSKHYVQKRIALVGDAAHVMHPLAGQGVNTGLLDVASLVQVVQDALIRRRDFASLHSLRRYERWRKADNQALMFGVDWIKKIFASDKHSAQSLRSSGLSLVDGLPTVKNIFMRHAVGDRSNMPAWLVSSDC